MNWNKPILKISLLALALSATLFSCAQNDKQKSPPLYNLAKFHKYKMPDILQEISGFAFVNGDTTKVYAQQDEDGSVFVMPLGTKDDKATKFDKKGDYEDMDILNNRVIVLKSDGDLFSFPLAEMGKEKADNVKKTNNLLPKGEYEGLYADAKTGDVYVLCKACKQDKGDKQVSGFILSTQPDGSFVKKNEFAIDASDLDKMVGKKKGKLHPSALAKNPITGDWYVISGVNKALLILDSNWKLKGAYHLNSNDFNQPEGIAFDKGGNLFISNEGSETTLGNILKFNINKK